MTARPRGEVCAAWPAAAGTTRHGGCRRDDAERGEQLRDRAVLAVGPVDEERDPGGEAEEQEADPEVEVAPPEGGRPPERDERGELEERAQRVDRGRLLEVGGHGEEGEGRGDREGNRQPAQPRPLDPAQGRPGDREPHREEADRAHHGQEHRPACATSSGVVVADEAICGITNCGAGPGFGPMAKVKAPWTGCPSTEIARQ